MMVRKGLSGWWMVRYGLMMMGQVLWTFHPHHQVEVRIET
jgi:hypothetical protein